MTTLLLLSSLAIAAPPTKAWKGLAEHLDAAILLEPQPTLASSELPPQELRGATVVIDAWGVHGEIKSACLVPMWEACKVASVAAWAVRQTEVSVAIDVDAPMWRVMPVLRGLQQAGKEIQLLYAVKPFEVPAAAVPAVEAELLASVEGIEPRVASSLLVERIQNGCAFTDRRSPSVLLSQAHKTCADKGREWVTHWSVLLPRLVVPGRVTVEVEDGGTVTPTTRWGELASEALGGRLVVPLELEPPAVDWRLSEEWVASWTASCPYLSGRGLRDLAVLPVSGIEDWVVGTRRLEVWNGFLSMGSGPVPCSSATSGDFPMMPLGAVDVAIHTDADEACIRSGLRVALELQPKGPLRLLAHPSEGPPPPLATPFPNHQKSVAYHLAMEANPEQRARDVQGAQAACPVYDLIMDDLQYTPMCEGMETVVRGLDYARCDGLMAFVSTMQKEPLVGAFSVDHAVDGAELPEGLAGTEMVTWLFEHHEAPIKLRDDAVERVGLGGLIGASSDVTPRLGGTTPFVGEHVRLGDPIIMGALDRALIDAVIRDGGGDIAQCHQRAVKRGTGPTGRVVIKFTIAATGRVSRAQVKSTTADDAELGVCVARVFEEMEFPQPVGGGIVIASYPFEFTE